MNYHEHFHPLKTVVYFQPSLLKNCLIYSTANEQIGELKQIIIIYQSMIFGIKVDNLQLIPPTLPLLVMYPFTLILSLKCNISPLLNSNLSHGPKSYKTDQVGFCGLSLNHSISGLECSNKMGQKPWYRGLNIVVKHICYHEFNYELVFLIFLICLMCFYWHTL